MRNSAIVYLVKMEDGPEIDIFVLKMMIKSRPEKKKSCMCKAFMEILFYFIVRRIFALNSKFRNKNDLLCARRDFNEKNCGVSTYYKGMFKPQISSIFHFDWVSDG